MAFEMIPAGKSKKRLALFFSDFIYYASTSACLSIAIRLFSSAYTEM
jgi:hypothetical protein